MPRITVALLVCAALLGSAHVSAQQYVTVDLNVPGALEALAEANPAHYRKIVAILDEVLAQQPDDVPRWLETRFDARGVSYRPLLLTSDPPKRDLQFFLDTTYYKARLTLTGIKAKIVPTR